MENVRRLTKDTIYSIMNKLGPKSGSLYYIEPVCLQIEMGDMHRSSMIYTCVCVGVCIILYVLLRFFVQYIVYWTDL